MGRAVTLLPDIDADKLVLVLEPFARLKVDSCVVVLEDVEYRLEVVYKLLLVPVVDKGVIDNDLVVAVLNPVVLRQRIPFLLKLHHHCAEV